MSKFSPTPQTSIRRYFRRNNSEIQLRSCVVRHIHRTTQWHIKRLFISPIACSLLIWLLRLGQYHCRCPSAHQIPIIYNTAFSSSPNAYSSSLLIPQLKQVLIIKLLARSTSYMSTETTAGMVFISHYCLLLFANGFYQISPPPRARLVYRCWWVQISVRIPPNA